MSLDEEFQAYLRSKPQRRQFPDADEFDRALQHWSAGVMKVMRTCNVTLGDLPEGVKLSTNDHFPRG